MRPGIAILLSTSLLATACGDTDDDGHFDAAIADAAGDARPREDAATDAALPDAAPPAPSMSMMLERADGSTVFPPARVVVTVQDAAGSPWTGAVTIEASNPDGEFDVGVTAVEGLGGGRYRAVVTADHSGEVAVEVSAEVEGIPLSARAVIVSLPWIAAELGIPLAVDELNTSGHEDSTTISPDGRTLFFSYSPIQSCNYFPSEGGDPPDKAECREPLGPIATLERPCTQGVGTDDLVALGLFGDLTAWPFPKSLFSSYAATRSADGTFGNPVCISFDDDGIIQEVGPSSGPASPVPGEPHPFFFGYPDWLNIDLANDGSVFAVATIEAGASSILSDPITQISSPPATVLAQALTGDLNVVRESAAGIGEFRVFDNPLTSSYEIYFERKETSDTTMDIVVAELEGTFPVGDWGAARLAPGEVNTETHDEGFPCPVDLPGGDGLTLFYSSTVPDLWSEPNKVLRSRWAGSEWGTAQSLIEVTPDGGPAGIILLAMPSVSLGDFGTEMFFVYVVARGDGLLDFQLGRVAM